MFSRPAQRKVSSVKPEKSAILVLKTVVFTSSKQVMTSELIVGYEFPVALIAPTTLCDKTACQKIRNNPGTVRKVLPGTELILLPRRGEKHMFLVL
ncbi:guanine nucleotide-binding protein G(I)/G(S)/G(O) subunit gamma-7 isoform X2 [Chelonia mydas]|uniref:guanine nucleotide-binding protein G(I)/G(S)/G(O) subunit gamma-7 isoform X2 n=1 Tax=Chelonia mydas TaxID=8469 RepID=UPI001CA8C22E|nr:guanine nucleotide-binding protein G(I)/G(S)/G(O) subunit gamma-7 isoform X2 [Chelonia mydas]